MADVSIKAGDVLIVRRQLLDGDGNGVNLESAEVRFQMGVIRGSREAVLHGSAEILTPEEITAAELEGIGWVEFRSEETDELGGRDGHGYRADFLVTFSDESEQSFPGGRDITIGVEPRAALVEEAS